MSLQQHIPNELRTKSLSVNSVIRGRTTHRFIPINGESNYTPNGKKTIEFQVNHQDLFDMGSLCLSLTYSSDNEENKVDGLISALFGTVEVYIADKLVERIENYGLWKNVITKASANDSFEAKELDAMSMWKDDKPDYVTSLDLLGITNVRQYLPLLQNNLRIVIKLASVSESHFETEGGVNSRASSGNYTLNNVTLLIDTVEVVEGYKAQLMKAISSENGIKIPIQTLDVKERKFEDMMNFNLSYAEADSFFGIVRNDNSEKPITMCPLDGFTKMTAKFSGKYLTPVDGLKSLSELYMAMRKSFASLHDASGSTCLDYARYKDEMTLIGIDCEKLPASNEIVNNGLNTRANGYQFDLSISSSVSSDGNKFYLAVLHRKIMTMASNSLEVAE